MLPWMRCGFRGEPLDHAQINASAASRRTACHAISGVELPVREEHWARPEDGPRARRRDGA